MNVNLYRIFGEESLLDGGGYLIFDGEKKFIVIFFNSN